MVSGTVSGGVQKNAGKDARRQGGCLWWPCDGMWLVALRWDVVDTGAQDSAHCLTWALVRGEEIGGVVVGVGVGVRVVELWLEA